MAYDRISDKKTIATNLTAFINNQITLIKSTNQARNLEDETRFTKQVLEEGLTLEQQLVYRQEQLTRVADFDDTEKSRVQAEVSSLKKQIRQKKYSDDYLTQLTQLNGGYQSIESTLSWLNSRLSNTSDPEVQDSIKKSISEMESKKFDLQQKTLENQTNYALKDQTDSIIDGQIEKVTNAKLSASRAGNDNYVTLLDLQLQALKKTKYENSIAKTLTDLSVSTLTGQSSLSMLDAFNGKISSANTGTPVTIGGVNYNSEQEFWQTKRNDYLNDRTTNGFFGRYQSELKEKVDYQTSKGLLSDATFDSANNWYKTLNDRPELKDYADKISMEKQTALQNVADNRANQILNDFAIKGDAKKTISALSYIQDTYGVDQTLNYQKIVSSASKEKESQIQEILGTMKSLMSANPGLSSAAAMEQAIKAGAGVYYSPEDLATTGASDLINNAGKKAASQQFDGSNPLNIDPNKEGKAFATAPALSEGKYYKTADSAAVYKYENGQLRPFEGSWNSDMFKKATGKGWEAVNTINTIAGVKTGAPILAQDYTNPVANVATTAATAPTATKTNYVTLFDYYKGQGKTLPTVQERAKLYESAKLGAANSYTGSAQQNNALISYLNNSSTTNQ